MSPIELTPRKVADGLLFGEGIRWMGERIVLSDMLGLVVLAVDPSSGRKETLARVPEQPNGLVVDRDGSLLILSMFDRKVLRRHAEGSIVEFADLSSIATGYLGDAVQDAAGNLYVDDVGRRVLHGEAPAPVGQVILVRPDGSAEAILKDLAFPNGIALSADGKRLYLVQSVSAPPGITVHGVANDGSLDQGQQFVTTDTGTDGIGIDDDEGIWACMIRDEAIVRFDREGQVTHRVVMTGYDPVACSIGGSNGRTMCITAMKSIGEKNIFEEMVAKRVESSVFVVDVPFPKMRARP